MNIIEEITTIRRQVDFLVSQIQGDPMFDPSVLQQELVKAQSLIAKSKLAVGHLQSQIKTHEATIAAHQAEFVLAANVESTVASLSSKFTEAFSEFETFLDGLSANTTANSVSNTATVVVSSPVLPPATGIPVAQTTPVVVVAQTAPVVVSTPAAQTEPASASATFVPTPPAPVSPHIQAANVLTSNTPEHEHSHEAEKSRIGPLASNT